MKRTINVLGAVAGLLMAATGAVHSLVGWKELQKALAGFNLPPDVSKGLAIPWHFTGLSMFIFGIIAIDFFVRRFRGGSPSMFPLAAIGVLYVAFTAFAVIYVKGAVFFAIFGAPGVLVLLGVFGGQPRRSAS